MLSTQQEKLIRALHSKKGRAKHQRCLVEGAKGIETAGDAIEFQFTHADSEQFDSLVTTEAPQLVAAVARTPQWTDDDVATRSVIVMLDGVQDPGNVGTILRLCLGFDASLVLVESADPTNPKVIRSSVGALFQVPWIQMKRSEAVEWLEDTSKDRTLYRLEKKEHALPLSQCTFDKQISIIVGSEGSGIQMQTEGQPLYIEHNNELESLNVSHALAIALYKKNTKNN